MEVCLKVVDTGIKCRRLSTAVRVYVMEAYGEVELPPLILYLGIR